MCDQLNLNATTAYAQFKDLADELFRDQQNGHQGKKYMFTDKKKIEMDFVTFKCQEGSWSDAERDEYFLLHITAVQFSAGSCFKTI